MADARELLRRVRFLGPEPSPHPDAPWAEHMLIVGFEADDRIALSACTNAPVDLAQKLRSLLAVLIEYPSIIEEAAGIRGAAFHLAGEPLRRLDDDE